MKHTRQNLLNGVTASYAASLIIFMGMVLNVTPASAEITLADAPLTMSTTSKVSPNVALLIDNSGSMKNIMWKVDPNFDPMDANYKIDYKQYFDFDHAYPAWIPPSVSNNNGTSDSVNVKDLHNNTGKTDQVCIDDPDPVASTNIGTVCITLPDPARDSATSNGRSGATTYVRNYVNFLFEYAKSNNLYDSSKYYDYSSASSPIPQETRMGAAQRIMSEMVTNPANDPVRFGLFDFNKSSGANLLKECGANHNDIDTAISGLFGDSSTPLSEAYHDITKYFRGQFGTYPSPIQYRCQQNVAIVVTDGYPTSDNGVNETYSGPNGAEIYNNRNVQNWDGKAPTTTAADYPTNIPPFSDGFGGGNQNSAGASIYLDDLAKFGFDIDLMPDTNGTKVDLDGVSFDDKAYGRPAYPAKQGPDLRLAGATVTYPAVAAQDGFQYLTAHTIGLATANQMLVDAAYYTRGTYASVDSADKLREALATALANISISARLKSVASVSISSGLYFSDETNYLFKVDYDPSEWKSTIDALPINYDSATNKITFGTAKSLSIPAAANRTIRTIDAGGNVIDFSASNSSSLSEIGDNASVVSSDTLANRIAYLRGDQSLETTANNGIYRARTSLLGDIINSAPAFVGKESNQYPNNMESVSYTDFVKSKASREPMIVVGANSGAVHVFSVKPTGDFKEMLAYVPRNVLGKLGSLTSPGYSHQYYVDGSATSRDAFFNGQWNSVVSMPLAKGAQAIVGLNVSNPSTFTTSWKNYKNAWEFSDANDADMGYVYTKPAIAKMPNGKWAEIFPNGYNSDAADSHVGAGKAVVYIRYLEDGTFVKLDSSIVNSSGAFASNNGMSGVTPVDLDGDFVVDMIYADDIQGNIWKFSLTANDTEWGTSANTKLLFSTCETQPCSQPITVYPTIGVGPVNGSIMLYFGTGKYLGNDDPTLYDLQSFYAIMDKPADSTFSVAQADLQTQTIVQQGAFHHDGVDQNGSPTSTNLSGTYRVVSNNKVDYYTANVAQRKKGWKLDLSYNKILTGERVTAPAVLRNGKIIFTTNYYTSNFQQAMSAKGVAMMCDAGNLSVEGGGWIMVLNALSGAPTIYSPFDTNFDNTINDSDKATINGTDVAVSGMSVGNANISGATVMSTSDGHDTLLLGSTGGPRTFNDTDDRETLVTQGGSWIQN